MGLKGIEKLNSVFEQFFVDLGYPEITVTMEQDFAYYQGTEEIAYSLLEMPLADIGFKNYLKKTYPHAPECSMFLFSFLHELGHHVTLPQISKRKMRECKKRKSIVNRMKDTTAEQTIAKQERYCRLYEEALATKEAVKILIENYDYILYFESVWFNAVMNFYKENGLNILTV